MLNHTASLTLMRWTVIENIFIYTIDWSMFCSEDSLGVGSQVAIWGPFTVTPKGWSVSLHGPLLVCACYAVLEGRLECVL